MAQFECDVFVSYATVNNQPMAEGKPGWVTSFRDVLKKNLDEGLGRRNAGEVWMDDKLRGNEPFDEQLRGKVSSSATLLVILSNGYLQSKWCRRELDIFVEAAGGERGASGRIFLVHYEPLSPTLWPTALRGLSTEKYRFFKQERDGATPIPLGYPIPNPEESDHASFYNRLRDLVPDLTRRLNDVAPRGEALVAREDGAKLLIAPTVSAVFLDEVTGDKLFDQRQLLKSHLEQSDLRVLPTRFYGRSLTSEMDDELSGCTLYIQMLGRFGGGYEAIHHERAIAKGLPVLRWRSRDLLVDSVDDHEHRKLLNSTDVEAMEFDSLIRTIIDRVRVSSAKLQPSAISGEHFVLVNAAAADMHMADAVAKQLEIWNVGYNVVDESVSLRDLAESNTYDALLVIYGACTHDWVRQQLIKCREILLSNKSRAPACAVYVGPPPKPHPLRCRPPHVAVIDTNDENQLRAFIEKLTAKEVSP